MHEIGMGPGQCLPMVLARGLAVGLAAGLVSGAAHGADLLDDVTTRGTLRIALEGSYPPFNFHDPQSGQLTGYDADVARLVAAGLGVKPQFVVSEWSAILPGLAAGKADVAVSQVHVTKARQREFGFSAPYTYSAPQLIVRSNERASLRGLADLKGRTVGVGQASVYEQQARAVAGIGIRSYPAAAENLQDLAFGRIDAVLNDSLMVAYLLRNSSLPLRAGPRVGPVERTAVAFRGGNPRFKAAVDRTLETARASGELRRLSLKWFGVDASREAR